jgi:hypothetical protein
MRAWTPVALHLRIASALESGRVDPGIVRPIDTGSGFVGRFHGVCFPSDECADCFALFRALATDARQVAGNKRLAPIAQMDRAAVS